MNEISDAKPQKLFDAIILRATFSSEVSIKIPDVPLNLLRNAKASKHKNHIKWSLINSCGQFSID